MADTSEKPGKGGNISRTIANPTVREPDKIIKAVEPSKTDYRVRDKPKGGKPTK